MNLEANGWDPPADPDRDQDREGRLDEIVAQYVEAVRSGVVVDREAWLARYRDFAEELGAFFEDYDRFGQVSEPLPPNAADACGLVGTRFGDYQILEQMARGGMGAV